MKKETKNRIRIISWILFVIYIGLLVYFLFLSEEYGRTSFDQRIYRYNLTPFRKRLLRIGRKNPNGRKPITFPARFRNATQNPTR